MRMQDISQKVVDQFELSVSEWSYPNCKCPFWACFRAKTDDFLQFLAYFRVKTDQKHMKREQKRMEKDQIHVEKDQKHMEKDQKHMEIDQKRCI